MDFHEWHPKFRAYGKQGLGLKRLTLQWLSRKEVIDVQVIGHDKNYFKTTIKKRRVQIFQRPKSNLKILGTGRITWSKFLTEEPQILGATINNFTHHDDQTPRICAPWSISIYVLKLLVICKYWINLFFLFPFSMYQSRTMFVHCTLTQMVVKGFKPSISGNQQSTN